MSPSRQHRDCRPDDAFILSFLVQVTAETVEKKALGVPRRPKTGCDRDRATYRVDKTLYRVDKLNPVNPGGKPAAREANRLASRGHAPWGKRETEPAVCRESGWSVKSSRRRPGNAVLRPSAAKRWLDLFPITARCSGDGSRGIRTLFWMTPVWIGVVWIGSRRRKEPRGIPFPPRRHRIEPRAPCTIFP